MTKQEYLDQARQLDRRIESDLKELSRLRSVCGAIDGPPGAKKPLRRTVRKLQRLEEEVDREVDRLVDLRNEIRGAIEALPSDRERMVLCYRYLHCLSWEKIGQEMHVNERTVRRWHGKALLHLQLPDRAAGFTEKEGGMHHENQNH